MEDSRISKKQKGNSISIEDSRFAFFDELPDDLVAAVISKVGATASCPADFFNLLLTCKRINALGFCRMVLSKVSPKAFTCKARRWCHQAHEFMKSCVAAGNLEAIYTLAMIVFYCLKDRERGSSLFGKGAQLKHPSSIYALSIIVFNRSVVVLNRSGQVSNAVTPRYLRIGLNLTAKAAALNHVDAIREMGYCLLHGVGIEKNEAMARQIFVQANARELASIVPSTTPRRKISAPPRSLAPDELVKWLSNYPYLPRVSVAANSPFLTDFGCKVPVKAPHPANQFLIDWFHGDAGGNLRICGRLGCGRPETRPHEYVRCGKCAAVAYCSRACHSFDWKIRHWVTCVPMVDNGNEDDEFEEDEAAGESDDEDFDETTSESDDNDSVEGNAEEIGIEEEKEASD